MTMPALPPPPSPSPRVPPHRRSSPKYRMSAFVGAAGLMAFVGLGSIAAGTTETEAVVDAPAAASQIESPDCDLVARLAIGEESEPAAAAAIEAADEISRYVGRDIALTRTSDTFSISGFVEDGAYLSLTADAGREDELIAFLRDRIDDDEMLVDHDVDLEMLFDGQSCDLASAADFETSLEDFFRSDVSVDFDIDDGECRAQSLFAGNDDFDFWDLDLDEFDLDLDFDDDRFAISLDTGDGAVSLACNADG